MDLNLTDDQELLAKEAREFLERECPTTLVRELREPSASGHSDALWSKLADLGWLGLAFPGEFGGGDATLFDLGLLYEQTGRTLVPTTLYSTIFAALLTDELGTDDQRRAYLGEVAAGKRIGTVALWERAAVRDPHYFSTQARNEGGGQWAITGEKAFVANAHLADPLLVAARTKDGVTVFAVPREAVGVELAAHDTFARDRQSRVSLDAVACDEDAILGGPSAVDAAWPAVDTAVAKATALQCMEMVGGAQRVLEMTIDYVKEREQFGRPIGSFQAVHHHVANLATLVEGARWTSYQAMWRISEGLPARREVAIAKAWTSNAYKEVTVLAHQLHGGMGYVLEHDLHLWSERAKTTELTFGPPDAHLQALADEVGL